MARSQSVIPIERIASRIYLIRGEKVMLDSDLLNSMPLKPVYSCKLSGATLPVSRMTLCFSFPMMSLKIGDHKL
jgi:hypothetical protein